MQLHHGTPQDAGMLPDRVEHVKALARTWVEDGPHPALVVLAARRGVIFLHEALGTLRPDADSPPLEKDSIFPMMSATKPVTAACVLALVEDGKVGLTWPVRDYFPEITGEGTDQILVHHLLCHLSGWRDIDVGREQLRRREEGGERPPIEPGQDKGVAAYLHGAWATPLSAPPGTVMEYSSLNYELLGELVRRASDKPLDQFARERIFEPLGMKDSSYVLPPEHRERKVRRTEDLQGWFLGPLFPGADSEAFEADASGPGGLHLTALDYAIFTQMLLNGGRYGGRRILSRASVDAMRRNHIPPGVPARVSFLGTDGSTLEKEFTGGYGYGLFPFEGTVTAKLNGGLVSPSSFSHTGALGIYWWADPERDLIGLYFSVCGLLPNETWNWRADLFVDALTASVEE